MLKALIHCMNLRSLPMGIAGVLAGTGCAALMGDLRLIPASLCLIFAILAQIAANLAHRYYDGLYSYGENIDDGLPEYYEEADGQSLVNIVREAMTAALILASMVGLVLMSMAGAWTILVGLSLIAAIYLNNAGSYPLTRSPWSLLPAFIFFGPVCTIGTCIVVEAHDAAASTFTWEQLEAATYMGIAIGIFVVIDLLQYQYTTYVNDLRNAKTTMVTKYGKPLTRRAIIAGGVVIMLLGFGVIWRFHLSHPLLLAIFPTTSMVVNTYMALRLKKVGLIEKYKMLSWTYWNMLFYSASALIAFALES